MTGRVIPMSHRSGLRAAVASNVRAFVEVFGEVKPRHSKEEVMQTNEPKLTTTEEEIVILVAAGKTNNEIASELDLSPRTVETYRLRLMKKMDLPHLPALVKFAIRNGLTETWS